MAITTKPVKLVILISGSGSNLQSFIDGCASGFLNAEIACVISNKPSAFGLVRAQNADIPTLTIDHSAYLSRDDFDQILAEKIKPFEPELIILAGFMRILTENFVNQFYGKLINIHPSLLPKYPGLNTHQRAIDNNDSFAGATVHLVSPDLDSGPSIMQAKVSISPSDNAKTLADRVLIEEHKLYPKAVKWIIEKKIDLSCSPITYLGEPIEESGISF